MAGLSIFHKMTKKLNFQFLSSEKFQFSPNFPIIINSIYFTSFFSISSILQLVSTSHHGPVTNSQSLPTSSSVNFYLICNVVNQLKKCYKLVQSGHNSEANRKWPLEWMIMVQVSWNVITDLCICSFHAKRCIWSLCRDCVLPLCPFFSRWQMFKINMMRDI